MDRGTRWAMVHGVAKSRTQLSDLTLANLLSPDLFFFTDSCREDFRFFLLGAIGPHGRLESRGVAPLGQPSGFRETMKMLKL